MPSYPKSVQWFPALACAGALAVGAVVTSAGPALADQTKGVPSPIPAPAPAKNSPSCRLLTEEAPRGGRLEVQTERVGRTPLVLVNGEVVRILMRKNDLISAQIPRDSDGGMVTIKVDGEQLPCGTLSIVGKN